jgi:hypothetical protein
MGLDPVNEVPATFKLFFGRAPRGEIKATVQTKELTTTLTLSDEIESRIFDLGTNDDTEAVFVGDGDIFHVAKITGPGANGFGIRLHTLGEVRYGTIKSFDGRIFPVTVERNTDSRGGPLRIFFFNGGKRQSLFLKPYQISAVKLPIVPITYSYKPIKGVIE